MGTKSNNENTGCDVCPEGTYSPSKSGACYNCPKGTFSKRGYSSCTPCPEGYYADIEGSDHCKHCPENTNSYMGSSFCFECPKGEGYCGGQIETKYDNREQYNRNDNILENIKYEEFGESITKNFFGVSIEFNNNYEVTFLIPGYKITVQLFNAISFEVKGDIQFKIENNELKSVEYGNEIEKNILRIRDQVEKALSGKYKILSHTLLRQKLCNVVSNGDISINYDFITNKMEIIIVSKIENGIYENDVGIKYIIEPTKIDFGYLVKEIADAVVNIEAPQFFKLIIDMTFDAIKDLLHAKNIFYLFGQIIVVIILIIFSLIMAAASF